MVVNYGVGLDLELYRVMAAIAGRHLNCTAVLRPAIERGYGLKLIDCLGASLSRSGTLNPTDTDFAPMAVWKPRVAVAPRMLAQPDIPW